MADAVRISEAASLALHTMVFLGWARDRRVSAKEIAGRLGVSEAHLSEVMQRLADAGIVVSEGSPGGGFALGKGPAKATLPEVLEATDGALPARSACWKGTRTGRSVIRGGIFKTRRRQGISCSASQVRLPMDPVDAEKRFPELTEVFGGDR